MTPSDGAGRSADPELLLRDQRWLVALARSLVGDEHAAEDVVQEARIAAWLHAPGDPSRVGGWLRRVVRNLSIRVRRSDTRRLAREQVAAPREATPATDELVARVEMQRAVAEAVLALDEPYRSAILLRFFDRLPPRDIAARLGAPVETVRTRLKRALEQLRAKLDRDFGARDAWAALLLPWTTVATATTKVGLKVAIAAVLIGSAGIATWEGVRRASVRANEGGAQVAAASATGPTEGSRTAGDDRGAATVDGATRSEDDAARVRLPDGTVGAIHVTARIVDASTHAPIAGARFTATYRASPGSSEASAQSDADGRIVLDFGSAEIRWFNYVVTHSDHAQLDGQKNFDGSEDPAASERRRAHDFGELALERGASVAGRVVRGPERTPVAAAKLLFLRSGFGHDFWLSESVPIGESRFDGSFELDERIATRGYSPILYAVTPTGIGWISPTIVKGRDRIESLEIEIEVPARLDARVVDESGAPIFGASVFALPRFPPFGSSSYRSLAWDAPSPGPGAWSDVFETTTDRDGRASLPYLPEGRNDDEISRRGGGNPRSYTVFAHSAIGQRRTAVASLHLEHGKTTEVKLVARRLVPLTIRGRVSDDRGQPVADAKIGLDQVGSATTDEAGLYELPPFTADRDRLGFKVEAEGHGAFEQELFDSTLGDRIVPIRGDDGAIEREELTVDFTMSSSLSVRGRVVDASGNGVARVGVSIQAYDSLHSSSFRRNGGTDEDGRFDYEGVPPGDCFLAVMPPAGFRGVSTRVVHAGDGDLQIRLVAEPVGRARLVADVVDLGTRTPAEIERAYLFPTDYGNTGVNCTVSIGSVTATGLHPGRWRLTIRTPGGGCLNHEFEVTDPDEEVRLHLVVGPPASILGHIARSNGQETPADLRPMVWLRAFTNHCEDSGHSVDAAGRTSTEVTGSCAQIEADGSFRIAGVTPGIPIRVFLADPTACGEAVLVLEPGEQRHVEIVLRPGAELRFRCVELLASGRFRLEVAREDGRFGLVTQDDSTHDDGTLMKEYFAPGHLRWRVTHVSEEEEFPRPRTVEGELEIVAGRPQVVDIRGLK